MLPKHTTCNKYLPTLVVDLVELIRRSLQNYPSLNIIYLIFSLLSEEDLETLRLKYLIIAEYLI